MGIKKTLVPLSLSFKYPLAVQPKRCDETADEQFVGASYDSRCTYFTCLEPPSLCVLKSTYPISVAACIYVFCSIQITHLYCNLCTTVFCIAITLQMK